jgi:tetratricopeptide (TPR) repeat protein/transcriptional regulator with XRE-family HTH domain
MDVDVPRAWKGRPLPVLAGQVASSIDTFGALLRFLRRRARLTQRELGLQVGYSEGHICRLEQNDRLPEPAAIAALFVPALRTDPTSAARLIRLAKQAREGRGSREDSAASTVPQIPAAPSHAVDRQAATAGLRALLAAEPVVIVQGLAGTGKTTLAAAIAREYAHRQPVCWITLTPGITASPEALVRQLARHLTSPGSPALGPLLESRHGVPPLPLDHQLDLLRGALAARPTLVCLDNAQALLGEDATLRSLAHLAAVAPMTLLLTSRTPLPLPGAAAFQLDGLGHAEGLELIGGLDPQMPPGLAERLLSRTAGHPMLLRLALGQARRPGSGREDLVEHLATNPEITAYLLQTTLDGLPPAAARLVRLLAVFRAPVDLHDEILAEESQAADGPYDLLEAIAEVRRRQLVDDPSAALLHPLVRDHVHRRLVGDLARRRRLHRAAAIWYEQARDDVLEAAWHLSQAGEYAATAEILAGRVRTLIGRGQALPAADLAAEVLARIRRRPATDGDLVRRLLVLLGDLLVDTTRAQEAEAAYRDALALDAPPPVRAAVARRLAESLLQRGQVREALSLCVEAAAHLDAAETLLIADLAVTQARAHLQLSEHDEALRVARYALDLTGGLAILAPELADDVAAGAHLTIGIVLRLHQCHEEAAAHLSTAATIASRIGLHHRAGRCLFNLGALRLERGELAEASKVLDEAIEQLRVTGDSYGLARGLHSIAVIRNFQGEPEAALALFEEACALKEQVGDRQGLANSRHNRALTLRRLGRIDEALAALEAVLASPAGRDEPWARANYLDSYATTLLIAGRLDEAPELLREAVELARSTGGMYLYSAERHLAVALLVRGEPELAERLAAQELPDRAGLLEAQLDARLLRIAVALYRRDPAAVREAADELAWWVEATGYFSYREVPEQLAAVVTEPPPLAELPKLLWLLMA